MDRLQQFRIFVQIASMGSFIKAANELEVPRSSVSAAIQALEANTGTRLLHRTTRHVQLTADGTQLFKRVQKLLADVEKIDSLFQTRQREASGRLNVDVPNRIARRLIVPALPEFLRRYPRLQLGLGSSDRAIDRMREGVDCVVHLGTLHDSSLVIRPLGHVTMITCVGPHYLRTRDAPVHPDDLTQGHRMVGYISPTTAREQPCQFISGGIEFSIPVPCQVIVNNAESYIACCLAGLGLIQIPRFDVQHLLERGDLVEVLPEFRSAPMSVSLLYPDRRRRSHQLNAFIEWFEALMQPHLESSQ